MIHFIVLFAGFLTKPGLSHKKRKTRSNHFRIVICVVWICVCCVWTGKWGECLNITDFAQAILCVTFRSLLLFLRIGSIPQGSLAGYRHDCVVEGRPCLAWFCNSNIHISWLVQWEVKTIPQNWDGISKGLRTCIQETEKLISPSFFARLKENYELIFIKKCGDITIAR